jgi:LmbE family N-acetylglucosaminyl deacetylase
MRADSQLRRLCVRDAEPPTPTVLVVAAHPDDETIGAGAALRRWGGTCQVVHVTDGAPRERRFYPAIASQMSRAEYARLRREEAVRALALAGLREEQIGGLGVRDQEAVFEMAEIAERLASIWIELSPDVVVTHAYEGGHPDHDATAFAVQAAAAIVARRRGAASEVVEMASYHDRAGVTVRGEFLPGAEASEAAVTLTEDEHRRKRAMLSAFATQREVLEPFSRLEVERFRVSPGYDFTVAPHDGRLHYERVELGMGSPAWRAFARSAARKLGLARASR